MDADSSAASELRVRMLGPPSIAWTDQPVTISRRQARALVYRLAVHLEVMSREQLCFLFWSDVPESTARRRLSRLVAHLRQALPAPDLLLTEGDYIRFDPDRVWSDTIAFQRFSANQDPGSLDPMQRAVYLYRGPFLAGFSMPGAPELEDWAFSEQRAFERLYLETLAALMEAQAVRGAYGEAIALAQRYLDVDDLAESIHRRLIEMYTAIGDRSAAVQQYERCAAILERELGVGPAPETQAAHELALQDVSHPSPPATILPGPPPAFATDTPLVGRGEAYQALWQAYAQAQRGRGRLVLISGEAGIGKSCLMREFAAQLPVAGVLLTGAAYASTQTTPFLPLVEALRSHLGARQAPLDVQPAWLGEVSLLLPELRTEVPGLPQPISASGEGAQSRLFEALRQLLLGLATSESPIVLCLDDLHRTDRATLNWLAYLGRHLRDGRILVMGAYRTEEVEAVSSLWHELRQAGVLEEVLLDPLTEEDALTLMQSLMKETPPNKALVRRLFLATGGNPFFLIETVRLLLETGQFREGREDETRLPLPGSIHEALRRQVERLSTKAQQSLATGAVLGVVFDFRLVQQMTGQRGIEIADGLDELVRRNLIVEGKEGYRFRHEMIQLAVYQDLSLGRRQLLHRRAAQALESLLSDGDVPGGEVERARLLAQVGRHYAEAGEAEQAIKFLLQAGDQTRLLHGHEEAIAHYRRALEALRASKDHGQTARTLMNLGLSYHNVFDFGRARQTYNEAFAEWQRAGRMPRPTVSATQAAATLRLAWSHFESVDPLMSADRGSAAVSSALFRGLVELNAELDVVPDLASSWEIRDGGGTYVFHLRDDVRWSDGKPVTAHDFEYAWKRLLSPALAAPYASDLYVVQGARAFHQGEVPDADRVGVQASDETTLVVTLEQPTSYLPYLLTLVQTSAVPRHVVEAHPRSWTEADRIVVNGPFRPETRQQGRIRSLVRNAAYDGSYSGNVQRVELHEPADRSALFEMYEANRLDVLDLYELLPSLELADSARQTHAGEYFSLPWLRTFYLRFDTERTPFDDPQVRRALALANDKEKLAFITLRGYEFPATGGFVPPGMLGHSAGIGLPYEPEEARRLLAQAGYPGGRGFPPVVAWGAGGHWVKAREGLRTQWQQTLGIDIAWEPIEWSYAARPVAAPPYHLLFTAYEADFPDPDNFLRLDKYSGFRWRSEAYDRLLAQARRVQNPQERLALYQQAERILVEEAAFVPLVYGRVHLLVKPWVKWFPVSPVCWWFWKDVAIEAH